MKTDGHNAILRYCPKCGSAALRPVGIKLVRCADCRFELYINTAAAVVALIFDEQRRLLITVRGKEPMKGTWDLPGGFADPGESAEDALRREILEELGLEIVSMRYLCSHPNRYDYMGVQYATMDLAFVCQVADLSRLTTEQSEIAQVLFVPPGDIDTKRFGFASIAKTVERYRAGLS